MRLVLALPVLLAACAGSKPSPPPRPFAEQGPYCTRTLGTPDCFANPYMLPDHPPPLGDTPVRTPQPAPNLLERIAHDWHQEE